MKPVLLTCWLLVYAGDAWAHRLDEYLQATRISVTTNRLDLSLELTPGVAITNQLLGVIDTDRDGQLSEPETTGYARRVLKDLQIGLDGELLALSLVGHSFPALPEIKGGVGVIRIKATAPFGPLPAGPHFLTLTNAHLPAISVYLVNAVRPQDAAIAITGQTRDEFQKTYRLEFKLKSTTP